jgi:hypothetical protein
MVSSSNASTDLNACAEFEKTLTDMSDYYEYLQQLLFITGSFEKAVFATAEQRCRAFVKVKENWLPDITGALHGNLNRPEIL